MPRRLRLPVVLLTVMWSLAACSHPNGAIQADAPASPPASSPPGPPLPADGAGPYGPGDCLKIDGQALDTVDCAVGHEYQVMLSQEFAGDADAYLPDVTVYRPVCTAALPVFLGSPDAEASRLETLSYLAGEAEWKAGNRWFACLIAERGPDDKPVPRTGTLAGALAAGLGELRRCLVDEPATKDATVTVPCDRPHRSEAVPGVLVLGSPADPAPGIPEMADRAVDHCEARVAAYLGDEREGVTAAADLPLPDLWPNGSNRAVCYAVTEEAVTGTLV
ncbi:septum formation family protein [Phytomonospora endophytica]|uniref:Septum formation-related domain-containing protein n=1 Tax=Phytomonospora endophytica TaxID=714109 RepID=A0A841FML2_9ACTN|nr:septum formation family protein [Phytomonospora endophytica]MBB6035038.1 hypothetical protein [Phytomonospora endophytica]GIG68292.1 hypothetical protein Pen01_45870 [Phytomonospora endophytica]